MPSAILTPGDLVPIDPAFRDDFARVLCREVEDLQDRYTNYFQDIAVWWRWYEGVPRIAGPKIFPFVGASNVIVPLIQIMSDAFEARTYAALFGHGRRVWMSYTENEEIEKQVENVSRFINDAANNNDFNYRLCSADQIQELGVIGESVKAINWRSDERWVYDPRTLGRKGVKPRAIKVRFARGAYPEHVPREQILWDTAYPVHEAPVVVRELHYTWTQIAGLAQGDNSWDRESIEAIRGRGDPESRAGRVVSRERTSHESQEDRFHGDHHSHDLREIHIDWPLVQAMGFQDERIPKPGEQKFDTPTPPLVAVVDFTNKKLLRLIAEPYNIPCKPFFSAHYRRRSGRNTSAGIAKRLQQMQEAMTASLNQALDARTRANSIWAVTDRKELLSKPFDPAHPVYVPPGGNFEPMSLATSVFDDMRLLTAIQTIAERQTGQADPALGRETRQGGHPSPATSTLALLGQSDLLTANPRNSLRDAYSMEGAVIASLYQQFEANEDGKIERRLGNRDAQSVQDFFFPTSPLMGAEINFDLVGMSESFNPDTEMKRAILVNQMNTNYWGFVLRVLQGIANPQVPPEIRAIAIESIKSQTRAHERFLQASEVDDLEHYVLQLAANEQAGAAELGSALGAAREIAGAGPGAPQPGMAGAPPAALGNGGVPQPPPVGTYQ